jgi:acyl-CoA thioester hydrolase
MIHKKEKYLASTTEVCSLYVDLSTRRVTEFEDSKRDLIQSFIDSNKDNFNSDNLHLLNKLKK